MPLSSSDSGVDAQLCSSIFKQYAEGGPSISSIFRLKCAILEATGKELSSISIKEKLRYYNDLDLIRNCFPNGSDTLTCTEHTFMVIANSLFSDREGFVNSVFDELDVKSRGYISKDDFLKVWINLLLLKI
jgi:hypothetical protein